MKQGDRYINRANRRVAGIVGANEKYVEYRYESLDPHDMRGTGKRETKPNTRCVTRWDFRKNFERCP